MNFNNNTNGPLASLYTGGYDFTNRFYPRNLGAEARGHYINFYINVAKRSQYIPKYSVIKNTAGGDYQGRTVENQQNNGYVNVNIKGEDFSFTRQTKRISDAISLYMPDTVNVQYGVNWESSSLTDAGGKALMAAQGLNSAFDSVVNAAEQKSIKGLASNPALAEGAGAGLEASGLVGSGATSFMMAAGGTALNPQLEVLFKGVDMRTFQFDFLFAPYSQDEADNVDEIIKTFKFHASPELLAQSQGGGHGRYFVPPSEFDIDFLFNGQVNTKIHKLATCVLTNVNVDYAPNGWVTLSDGSPVSSRMTLQFQEVEIITKQRILEGY